MNHIDNLQSKLESLRLELKNHDLYKNLKSVADVRVFMEHHVFAVWDFMSLLKALQLKMTCTQVPWMPAKSPTLSYFINDIVLGEESDVDESGAHKSHFEIYLEAMGQVGAKTTEIAQLIDTIKKGHSVEDALKLSQVAPFVYDFVSFTFGVIATKEDHKIAAAFAFGREDLIPDMFLKILEHSDTTSLKYSKLIYYLKRHIEVDGDKHGPLACQMISELCGGDPKKWEDVLAVSSEALKKRILLWSGIDTAIKKSHQV